MFNKRNKLYTSYCIFFFTVCNRLLDYYYESMIPFVIVPFIVWWIIQIIKIWIDFLSTWKISLSSIWSAWWFPSFHSGIAASITTLMLLYFGIESAEFAISFCFSFLFRYDAANIRYQAGQHATLLNKIQQELEKTNNVWEKMMILKERLWHTWFEVLWWIIVGSSLTITYFLLISKGILI